MSRHTPPSQADHDEELATPADFGRLQKVIRDLGERKTIRRNQVSIGTGTYAAFNPGAYIHNRLQDPWKLQVELPNRDNDGLWLTLYAMGYDKYTLHRPDQPTELTRGIVNKIIACISGTSNPGTVAKMQHVGPITEPDDIEGFRKWKAAMVMAIVS